MKAGRLLSPTLAVIERRLFGVSEMLMNAVERGETSPSIATAVRQSPEWAERSVDSSEFDRPSDLTTQSIEMPAHLQNLVRQRLTANATMKMDKTPIPSPGQIVEVSEIKTPREGQLDWVMQVPLYVLLDAPAESEDVWHGWLVSGEMDYAGWFDFVLQEEDEPFAPEASVVQLWNPVRIYMPMATRAVGRLSLARLQAVRALAAEYVTNDRPVNVKARPGKVAARSTTGGLIVATGSPLGDESDPRHRYQQLYFHAAEAIRQPARLALEELVEDQAPNPILSFLNRLFEEARQVGQEVMLVPSVEVAMNAEEVALELDWEGTIRIGIQRISEDGSGQAIISVLSEKPVICELRVGGVLENKLTARSGEGSIKIDWEAGESTTLTLIGEGNQPLELVLIS